MRVAQSEKSRVAVLKLDEKPELWRRSHAEGAWSMRGKPEGLSDALELQPPTGGGRSPGQFGEPDEVSVVVKRDREVSEEVQATQDERGVLTRREDAAQP